MLHRQVPRKLVTGWKSKWSPALPNKEVQHENGACQGHIILYPHHLTNSFLHTSALKMKTVCWFDASLSAYKITRYQKLAVKTQNFYPQSRLFQEVYNPDEGHFNSLDKLSQQIVTSVSVSININFRETGFNVRESTTI
jgi:hypothetical protein